MKAMIATMEGRVVAHKEREWTDRNGQKQTTFSYFLRQDGSNEAYAADEIECKADERPAEGSRVVARVLIRARAYLYNDEPRARMTVWQLEHEVKSDARPRAVGQ